MDDGGLMMDDGNNLPLVVWFPGLRSFKKKGARNQPSFALPTAEVMRNW
jgi:hypothetical protein